MSYGLNIEMHKRCNRQEAELDISFNPTSCPSCRLWPAPDPTACGAAAPSLLAVRAGTGLLSLSALGSQAHLSEDKNEHEGDTHQEDDGEKSD
ncbi:Amino-terminal enhancer of split [Camelus dromedarius]|uniref:Amino-terminal enhancer of split n=1 Tax=Camelus dromedarius TaxID=9838 RepID=A0A5N4CCH1_CAMDR|nr:Amino-terminal enhancer of split [Camelus dromedarius]